ncbi:kunitz-type serine protease inhibitor bitisilin-3-like [Dendropsophus ebraccatus]|uniref:kunitz-type serine protease inhibitor bitisilin-3-like n=1 Tax=Dendropsophus ebraccatus TaxID=150705 RepID=UPI003831DA9B
MSSGWIFLGLLLIGITRAEEKVHTQSQCEVVVLGDSSGREMRWTYDPSQDACKKILQKNTEDGINVFRTERDCLSLCSKAYGSLYPPGEAVCNLTMDPGPCLSAIFMWYYDKNSKICDSFLYGGCQGNGNRFSNRTECISRCLPAKKGKSGASDAAPSGSGTDAGLVIGVLFGVIFGLAFLVTLGMYLVQRKKLKKQKHQRVPDTEMK